MNILHHEPCIKKAKPKIAPDAEGWYDFSEICPLSSDRETFGLCRVCCTYRVPQQGFKPVARFAKRYAFFSHEPTYLCAIMLCATQNKYSRTKVKPPPSFKNTRTSGWVPACSPHKGSLHRKPILRRAALRPQTSCSNEAAHCNNRRDTGCRVQSLSAQFQG